MQVSLLNAGFYDPPGSVAISLLLVEYAVHSL